MIVVEFLLQQKNIRDDALHYIGAIYNDFPLLRLAHRDTFYVTVQNTYTHNETQLFVFKIQFEIRDLLSLYYFFFLVDTELISLFRSILKLIPKWFFYFGGKLFRSSTNQKVL